MSGNHTRGTCWWCWQTVWTDEHDFFACHDAFTRPTRERAQRRRDAKARREATAAVKPPTLFPSTGAE